MRHLRTFIYSALLLTLTAGTAHAADGKPVEWMDLLARIATTALVVGVIWKLAGAKIYSFFAGRRSGIAQELSDLESRKEQAGKALADMETRIANLESERAAIIVEYTARGEAVKAEIIAKAEASAAQITTQAKQAAQNEIDKALAAMREDIAEEIATAAEKALAGSLTEKDHEKLLGSVLDKVVLQ